MISTKRRCVVSNMYPSTTHPNYGVFVKNFESSLRLSNYEFSERIVIRGKPRSTLEKLAVYGRLWVRVFGAISTGDVGYFYVHYFTHNALPFFFGILLGFRPSFVVNFHGDDLVFRTRTQRVLFHLFASTVLPKARLLVVPSLYFREELCKHSFVDSRKVEVSASGGVSPVFFRHHRNRGGGGPIRLVTASRLDPGKGLETILAAATTLKARGVDFHWTIIGDGQLRIPFEQSIHSCGLGGCFDHLGMLDQPSFAAAIAQDDYFVFPTKLKESLGLVALEAMAVRLPVIASRIGAVPSYVRDGFNGFLFDPGNADQLVENLVGLPEPRSSLYELLSRNALETAKSYSREAVGIGLSHRLSVELGGL